MDRRALLAEIAVVLGLQTAGHSSLYPNGDVMKYERKTARVQRKGKGNAKRAARPIKYDSAWSDHAPKEHLKEPPFDNLSEAPEELQLRAAQKLSWIQRFVLEGCPRGKLGLYAEDVARSQGRPLSEVPKYSTLNTWVHRYRAFGLLGLVDKPRKDAGTSRNLTPDQEHQLKVALIGGKANVAAAHRALVDQAKDPEAAPSYDVVRRATQRLLQRDPHLAAIARHGVLWWRNHFRLSLSHGVLPGGHTLAIDSTVCDVWVRIENKSVEGGWEAVRVALTVIEDIGSRLLVAFNLSIHAVDSGVVAGTFLRACNQEAQNEVHPGLISTGVPHEVVIDQGPEHRGKFARLLERLGVQVRKSRPNSPQSHAHVESLIGSITAELFRSLPGYSATHGEIKPHAPAETDAKRRLSDLKYAPYRLELPVSALLTIEELEMRILAWAMAYNQRPHKGLPAENAQIQRLIQAAMNENPSLSTQAVAA